MSLRLASMRCMIRPMPVTQDVAAGNEPETMCRSSEPLVTPFDDLFSYPVTEWDDPDTINIDIATPQEIVRQIFNNESQLFPPKSQKGLLARSVVDACAAAADLLRSMLTSRAAVMPRIVLVGAGTSGRLCYFIASLLREEFKGRAKLVPLIAGSAKSLTRGQTGAEDDAAAGVRDFRRHVPSSARRQTLVLGVSCGLSSAYVAAVLAESLKGGASGGVLIGFAADRDATVDIKSLLPSRHLILVNPDIGPEPISGSVRMKGGTATIIILHAILMDALRGRRQSKSRIRESIETRRRALTGLRTYEPQMGHLIDLAGTALRAGGNLHLLAQGALARLCVYDVAECFTTFGASREQVAAYSARGCADLAYYRDDAVRLKSRVRSFRSFHRRFRADRDRAFTLTDTLSAESLTSRVVARSDPSITNLVFGPERASGPRAVDGSSITWFELPSTEALDTYLFARVVLVHVSTGAFIRYGRVLRNRMIDLRITSRKLMRRAIRLLSEYAQLSPEASVALLRQVVKGRGGQTTQRKSDLIRQASHIDHIIPRALLLSLYPDLSGDEVDHLFRDEPVLRRLVLRLIAAERVSGQLSRT